MCAKGGSGSNAVIGRSLRFNGIAVDAKLGSWQCIVGREGAHRAVLNYRPTDTQAQSLFHT